MWNRYWLFHATDFQSLMYPCFTFCRILGIFPYKINASTFEISKRYFILLTIIICACGICDLLIIHDIFKTNLFDTTKTLKFVCYYVCNGFIMLITHILSGPRMRLLQIILKISSTLPPECYQKLSKLIHIKDIFGIILSIMQISIYSFRNHMFKLNYKDVLIAVFIGYLTVLEFEINMLYINCVCVLKACFKRLNENMAHLQKLVVKPCVPRLIYHIQRNQLFLIQLKILQKQHLMISDTKVEFNLQSATSCYYSHDLLWNHFWSLLSYSALAKWNTLYFWYALSWCFIIDDILYSKNNPNYMGLWDWQESGSRNQHNHS